MGSFFSFELLLNDGLRLKGKIKNPASTNKSNVITEIKKKNETIWKFKIIRRRETFLERETLVHYEFW